MPRLAFAITFLAGLALGTAALWLGPALLSGLPLSVLRGQPPAPPVFPARVMRGPGYDSGTRPFLSSLEALLSKPARERYGGLRETVLYRHRSLPLRWNDTGLGDAGLMAELAADARRRGWTQVPGLALDLPALASVAAFEQGGYVFVVIAYSDWLAPGPANPGANQAVEAERWACWDEARQVNTQTGKREPCDTVGLVPVSVWTDIPAALLAAKPFMAPDAPDLAKFAGSVWTQPRTWAEIIRTE